MNERIKELARRADQYANDIIDERVRNRDFAFADIDEVYNTKFAELIVRECARSLWTEECHTSDLAVEEFNRNSKKIKQHFGVEE